MTPFGRILAHISFGVVIEQGLPLLPRFLSDSRDPHRGLSQRITDAPENLTAMFFAGISVG